MDRSEIFNKFEKNTLGKYSESKIKDISEKIYNLNNFESISEIFMELKI